ncbi:MAG: hypothetical protein KDE54_35905, partial [Caldilineaceae bacterium]|nr:hypothetical protein [Caldilineaceae bacterium]MCB0143357.1 hypothetical protein [Caldilineaceae bacterium]
MDALNPARPESMEETQVNAGEVQPEQPKSQEGDVEAQASADAELDLPTPLRADSALTDAVTAFNNYMVRKGFSENTMKAFRNDLKILINFLDGATPLHRIT